MKYYGYLKHLEENIRKNENLFDLELSMPQFSDRTEFGLNNSVENKKFLEKILKKPYTIIYDGAEHFPVKFYRIGTINKGYYIGVDTNLNKIFYLVQYNVNSIPKLNLNSVTQTKVWRDDSSKFALDLTKLVVSEILLAYHTSIMSDKIQTREGERFWSSLVTRLWDVYNIALVNTRVNTVFTPNKNEESSQFWERVRPKAYVNNLSFQDWRFVISKTPINQNK